MDLMVLPLSIKVFKFEFLHPHPRPLSLCVGVFTCSSLSVCRSLCLCLSLTVVSMCMLSLTKFLLVIIHTKCLLVGLRGKCSQRWMLLCLCFGELTSTIDVWAAMEIVRRTGGCCCVYVLVN